MAAPPLTGMRAFSAVLAACRWCGMAPYVQGDGGHFTKSARWQTYGILLLCTNCVTNVLGTRGKGHGVLGMHTTAMVARDGGVSAA